MQWPSRFFPFPLNLIWMSLSLMMSRAISRLLERLRRIPYTAVAQSKIFGRMNYSAVRPIRLCIWKQGSSFRKA